ncbi:MAG: aldehyde dehydrogenase (NADP(+)), partial [Opitutae bacterium]|nr:aldehyde dehydrogenase (NADP(+)) [Opitutae bacterium]
QFCTNPGIVFYPDNELGAVFRNSFVEKMKTFSPASMLHNGICESYVSGIKQLSSQAGVEELLQSDSDSNKDGSSVVGACVLHADVECFLNNSLLSDEVFGPATLLVSYSNTDELINVIEGMEGQLTASLFGTEESLSKYNGILDILETKVGRMLFNQFPTGVEVCPSIVHGGPYPATTDSRSTSVGTASILRFARPVCYQGFPDDQLPLELRDDNPLGINRTES